MATVTGGDVAAFMGQLGDAGFSDLAEQHVQVVQALARGYTRGRGFDPATGDPADDLAAVITTATARLLANPEQLMATVGGITVGAGFAGWSLAETFILNRYRKRATG